MQQNTLGLKYVLCKVVMGPGQYFLTPGRVGSIFCCSNQVGSASHLWCGFGFGKFPLKITNFQISLGWVKKCPGQRRVSL